MSEVLFWRESDEFTAGEVIHACPHCESNLTIHQPDQDVWNRLLATCDDCKSWFLTDSERSAFVAITASLDDRDFRVSAG